MIDNENNVTNNNDNGGNNSYRWNNPAPESASYHTGRSEQSDGVYKRDSAEDGGYHRYGDSTANRTYGNSKTGYYSEPIHPSADENVTSGGGSGKSKKEGGTPMSKRMVAMALVCALVGGAVGAGITTVVSHGTSSASVSVSDRTVATVKQVKVDGQTEMTPAEIYAANVNAVVSINVSGNSTNIFGQTVENASAGSGFIITADGYIVTNYHVVENANTISVTSYDGTTYNATYVGGDSDNDIAVIKIDASDLQTVIIGDSDSVNVGDSISAVGNPLGELTFSMTTGSVSSVDRSITVDGTAFDMIQVDCAINPGNSGGPLFNSYGEVIGIVSAKYTNYSTTTVEGVGFAIPISLVWDMVEDIMQNGYVTDKAYIGISARTIDASTAQAYNMTEGVYVVTVEEGSAAEKAGLQTGDIITAINDTEITSMDELSSAKKGYKSGDTVTLTVYRSGESTKLDLTFGTQPATDTTQADTSSSATTNGSSNGNYYYYYNGNGANGSSFSFGDAQ